jgi:hypothetical protein
MQKFFFKYSTSLLYYIKFLIFFLFDERIKGIILNAYIVYRSIIMMIINRSPSVVVGFVVAAAADDDDDVVINLNLT